MQTHSRAEKHSTEQGGPILTIQRGTAPLPMRHPEWGRQSIYLCLVSKFTLQACKDMHGNGDTYFRPSVHDVNEVASRIGFPDGLEHLLVLEAPGTEAGQGLAAPADGRLRDTASVSSHRHLETASPATSPWFTDTPSQLVEASACLPSLELGFFLIQARETTTRASSAKFLCLRN